MRQEPILLRPNFEKKITRYSINIRVSYYKVTFTFNYTYEVNNSVLFKVSVVSTYTIFISVFQILFYTKKLIGSQPF